MSLISAIEHVISAIPSRLTHEAQADLRAAALAVETRIKAVEDMVVVHARALDAPVPVDPAKVDAPKDEPAKVE